MLPKLTTMHIHIEAAANRKKTGAGYPDGFFKKPPAREVSAEDPEGSHEAGK